MPRYPFPQIPARDGAAGCRTPYYAPMCVGDVISSRSMLMSVTRKRLRIGDGAFMVVRTGYFTGDEVLASSEDMTVFRYSPEADEAA
jgi:hypothetical protein